ncbi:MAG: S-layer homology domain-containing protein [Candidatus Omnitrophota bacterium]
MRKILLLVPVLLLLIAGCATVATVPTLRSTDQPATRAQLATYFIDRLQLDKKLEVRVVVGDTSFKPAPTVLTKPERKPEISDIGSLNRKEKADVEKAVELGVLALYPDNTFRPMNWMSRAEFAVTLERILVYFLGDRSLATKFIGNTSPFADVSNSHYAFNAIMTATTRGLMKGTTKGTFDPMGYISGKEALAAIDRLKPLL